MLVFAHLGHILIDLPLFAGPVLLLVLALWGSAWRQKRHGASHSADPPPGDAGRPAP